MKKPLREGMRLRICGVAWDDGWEFDCPTVIYAGLKAYSPNTHSTGESSVRAFIEDKLYDVVVNGEYRAEFSESELREFEWRGWSPRGFRRRRAAHAEMVVEFYKDEADEWAWREVSP